ncbi:hypothetical protein PMNALOAF_4297 [Methylobacterium adhaesivum]|uniref:Phospholipase A2 domain-containing protein n=1 Tax=Methylobacterium adhaesivum TaxID=333297 RepID=A0ABT8BMY3_9HYPH|nr:hypothetical protein [Methylobacterium adhaesivum]MDN3593203.1 hypothetical protein [Methylobacterium adhaesivum]GJD33016.1 hypothetical protein PMNALOAF_4297 [Methylobacterium adhaesivum]
MRSIQTIPFVLLLAAPVLSWALPAAAQPAAGLNRPLLVHGNYCGPGNNAPLPPIDALDAACARHDACTPTGGLPSKACNLRLEREASAIARDPRQSPDLRAMAGLVSTSIAMLPSEELVRPVTHRPDEAASQSWDASSDGED